MNYKISIAIAFVFGVLVSSSIAQEIETTATTGIVQLVLEQDAVGDEIVFEDELLRDGQTDWAQSWRYDSRKLEGEYTPDALMFAYMSGSSDENVFWANEATSAVTVGSAINNGVDQRELAASTSTGSSEYTARAEYTAPAMTARKKGAAVGVSPNIIIPFLPLLLAPILFAPVSIYFFYRRFTGSKTTAVDSQQDLVGSDAFSANETFNETERFEDSSQSNDLEFSERTRETEPAHVANDATESTPTQDREGREDKEASRDEVEIVGEENNFSEAASDIETEELKSEEVKSAEVKTSLPSDSRWKSKATDDLTKLKGIGPASAKLLNDAGIWSYQELSLTELTRLQKILADGGEKFSELDPQSWSTQADYAANGDWEGLEIWNQHQDPATETEVQSTKLAKVQLTKPADDLTAIRGIGPKTNEKLNELGIERLEQIAVMTGQQVIELLEGANARSGLNNPQSWPQQARDLVGLSEEELENDIIDQIDELSLSVAEIAQAKPRQTQKQ